MGNVEDLQTTQRLDLRYLQKCIIYRMFQILKESYGTITLIFVFALLGIVLIIPFKQMECFQTSFEGNKTSQIPTHCSKPQGTIGYSKVRRTAERVKWKDSGFKGVLRVHQSENENQQSIVTIVC